MKKKVYGVLQITHDPSGRRVMGRFDFPDGRFRAVFWDTEEHVRAYMEPCLASHLKDSEPSKEERTKSCFFCGSQRLDWGCRVHAHCDDCDRMVPREEK